MPEPRQSQERDEEAARSDGYTQYYLGMTPEWSVAEQPAIPTRTMRVATFYEEELHMILRQLAVLGMLFLITPPAYAATSAGDAKAGRDLVLRSCTSCHAVTDTSQASDGAPPLSYIARDNKERPAWIHGWLMDPHPPMPEIMLSRKQINDIIAYLDSLPVQKSAPN